MAAAELPPRLSDRQLFILAWLARAQEDRDEDLKENLEEYRGSGDRGRYNIARYRFREHFGMPYQVRPNRLSRAVAEEFGEIEEIERKTEEEILDGQAEQLAAAETEDERKRLFAKFEERNKFRRALAAQPSTVKQYDDRMTDNHLSTHSRSLDRLEERGLIERGRPRGQSRVVWLTESGEEAGCEALRRTSDGRYSLSFRTID